MQKTNSFDGKLERCIRKISFLLDNDYLNCTKNYVYAISKGKSLNSMFRQEFIDCCAARMVNFKCFRTLLTTKCKVSEEEVLENDDQHFNYWNNLDIPKYNGRCGEKQQTLRYCNLADYSDDKVHSGDEIYSGNDIQSDNKIQYDDEIESDDETISTIKVVRTDDEADSSNTITIQTGSIETELKTDNQKTIFIPAIISLPKTRTSKLIQHLFNHLKNYQIVIQFVKKDSNHIN